MVIGRTNLTLLCVYCCAAHLRACKHMYFSSTHSCMFGDGHSQHVAWALHIDTSDKTHFACDFRLAFALSEKGLTCQTHALILVMLRGEKPLCNRWVVLHPFPHLKPLVFREREKSVSAVLFVCIMMEQRCSKTAEGVLVKQTQPLKQSVIRKTLE